MSISLVPAGSFAAAAARVAERLGKNPNTFVVDRGPRGVLAVFTLSPKERDEARALLAREGRVSHGYGTAQISKELEVFILDATGAPASVAEVRALGQWIFENLGPCRVFDDDEDGAERTDEVKADPTTLFGAPS